MARWNSADQAVDLVIDGTAVIDIVDIQRQWGGSPFARRFSRAAVHQWLTYYRGACGDMDCGNLAIDVEMAADTVTWRRPHWAGDADENDDEPDANDPESLFPQLLVFNRVQYDTALIDAERFIARSRWRRQEPEAAIWLDRLRNRFMRLWNK